MSTVAQRLGLVSAPVVAGPSIAPSNSRSAEKKPVERASPDPGIATEATASKSRSAPPKQPGKYHGKPQDHDEGDANHPSWGEPDGAGEEFKTDDEGVSSDNETDGGNDDNGVDLLQGRIDAAEARNTTPKPRPQAIEKHWKAMYPLVKTWWRLTAYRLPVSHRQRVDKIQQSIIADCKKIAAEETNTAEGVAALADLRKELDHGNQLKDPESQASEAAITREAQQLLVDRISNRMMKMHRFPDVEIYSQMASMTRAIADLDFHKSQVEDADDGEARTVSEQALNKEMDKLLAGFAVFAEKLKGLNIPIQSIISSYASETFNSIVNGSPEAKKRFQAITTELNKPTKDQENVWTEAALGIHDVVKDVLNNEMISEAATERVDAMLLSLRAQDAHLQQSNTKNKLDMTTNCLPLSLLNEMVSQWKNGNQQTAEEEGTALMVQLQSQPLATTLVNSLIADDRSMIERLLPPNAPSLRPIEASAAPLFVPQTRAAPQVPLFVTPAPSVAQGRALATPGAATVPSREATTNETVLERLQALRASLANTKDSREMPDYRDGVTEFGHHVATRPSSTDNVRYSRFVVNAGTIEHPYYRMVQGSELSPGGAEKLSRNTEKETFFDLRQMRRAMDKAAEADELYIKKAGPCIQIPRADGYQPKPGKKQRREDSYIRVEYVTNEVHFLSRTQYTSLVGANTCKVDFGIFIPRFLEATAYRNACRQANLHPDTLEPLTEQDRKVTPWFFSDGLLDYKLGGNAPISSERKAMSEPRSVVEGALSEPFTRPRAEWPTPGGVVNLDEEL